MLLITATRTIRRLWTPQRNLKPVGRNTSLISVISHFSQAQIRGIWEYVSLSLKNDQMLIREKANIPGKPRESLNYTGGIPKYVRESKEVAEKGYAGFAFDAPYDTAGVKA
jgi:hypothetical protein